MNRRLFAALLVAVPLVAAGAAYAQPAPPPPGYAPGMIVPPGPELYAPMAPPAPRVEPIPAPPPGEVMVWHPGHWQWEPHRREWVWAPGVYVERPHRLAAWEPGHWAHRRYGWTWVPGHWK
jgi:hypothetical protein